KRFSHFQAESSNCLRRGEGQFDGQISAAMHPGPRRVWETSGVGRPDLRIALEVCFSVLHPFRQHRRRFVADFKTHISGSTIVGAAYGYWGTFHQGMSIESGLLAAGLCSVAGMLPDLDSH